MWKRRIHVISLPPLWRTFCTEHRLPESHDCAGFRDTLRKHEQAWKQESNINKSNIMTHGMKTYAKLTKLKNQDRNIEM